MIYGGLLLMCILFIEISVFLGVFSNGQAIISSSKRALALMSSPDLDDLAKETAARQSSYEILMQTFLFVLKFAIVTAGLAILYFALIEFTEVSQKEFTETAFSWGVIAGLTIFSLAYAKIRYVWRQ